MLQNSRACFSEGSEAPQAVHHTRTLLGDPKTVKKITKAINNQQKSIKLIGYMLQKSRAFFFWRFWGAASSASHTHPAGRPQSRQKYIQNSEISGSMQNIKENPFDTQIPGYVQIPQIPDSHYCPDTRIHLPGYKPGYYPPASSAVWPQAFICSARRRAPELLGGHCVHSWCSSCRFAQKEAKIYRLPPLPPRSITAAI